MNIDASRAEEPRGTPWGLILAFSLTATLLAYPFRHGLFDLGDTLLFGVPFLQAMLEGAGVFIAAAVFTRGFKRFWRPATYGGDSPAHSLMLWLIPALVFGGVGMDNTRGVNPHLFGATFGAAVSIYCLFEETGWRGFLQNAGISLERWKRYLIVGLIWYAWHLDFLGPDFDIAVQLKALVALVLGSFLLGSLVEKTNSVLVAASFHFAFNFIAFNQVGGVVESGQQRMLLVMLVVLAWAPVLIHWNIRKKRLLASAGA